MTTSQPPSGTADAGFLVGAKGHGTANDFVLLSDPDGLLDFRADLAARIADRRRGIGGDGVIRVVRTVGVSDAPESTRGTEWFMDYRNADGSLSQMCGNGVRVFAEFLVARGLVSAEAASTEGVAVGTRAGVRRVFREPSASSAGVWRVDMGEWSLRAPQVVAERGGDVEVRVAGLPGPVPGVSVSVGNPHVVVALRDEAELATVDFSQAPEVSPHPEGGTNVEAIVVHPDAVSPAAGVASMRVHERGSGETWSCGTGTCAAAVAAHVWAGPGAPVLWHVDVPGGRLEVALEGSRVWMTGPAVLVGDVRIDPAALASIR